MGRSKILWIARTAIFIALLVAVQAVTRSMGQFVTGSLVNFVLLTSALTCGLYSGLVVAAISPFLAFWLGIGPAFIQLTPAIALGNIVIVLIVYFTAGKALAADVIDFEKSALAVGGVIIGAAAKFFVLWLLIVKLLLPVVPNLKPQQVQMLSASFSWPQLVTALIGGALTLIVFPLLRKALRPVR